MTVIPRLVSVVLNDETLRESLSRAIRVEGHRAAAFADGASAWGEASTRDTPALAIIEIGIPGGEELCRRYRDWSPSMAIVVVLESEEALERAEEMGLSADDYLAKPFSVREVVSRVKVLVRRVGLVPGAAHAWEDRPLMLGALTVDPVRLTAHWNGQDVGLTVTEFMLMHALVRRTGVVKTREQLMQEAFPDHAAGADRMIDAYIKRLQQRFLRVDPRFDALEGVHDAGYRYRTGR
jgi:two-component system response regulator ChvI